MVDETLDRGRQAEVTWNPPSVTPAMRAGIKRQVGKCIWFTGLSAAGKTCLANALEVALNERGYHTMLLDGDNVRHGLCADLDMSARGRAENIRRVGEVAKLFTEAGLIVMTALISPFRGDRDRVRRLFHRGEFIEVHVNTPLAVCEHRDPKGLYRRARLGEITEFTGISSPYEAPSAAELTVDTEAQSQEEIIALLLPHCLPPGAS